MDLHKVNKATYFYPELTQNFNHLFGWMDGRMYGQVDGRTI